MEAFRRPALNFYLWLVSLSGLTAGAFSLYPQWVPRHHLLVILLGVVVAILAESRSIKVGAGQGIVSLASASYFSVFLVAGMVPALWVLTLGTAIGLARSSRGLRLLAAIGMNLLAFVSAAHVYDVLRNHVLLAVLGFIVVSLLVNHLIVNIILYHLNGAREFPKLLDSLLWDAVGWLLSLPLISLFVLMDRAYSTTGAFLAVLPFISLAFLLALYYQNARLRRHTLVITEISTRIARTDSRELIFRYVEQAFAQVIGYTTLAVYLQTAMSDTLRLEYVWHPLGKDVPYDVRLSPDDGLAGWAMKSHAPEWVQDSQKILGTHYPRGETHPLRSALILPLAMDRTLLGLIVVGDLNPNRYDNNDFQLAKVVSAQVTAALKKSLHHQEALARSTTDPVIPAIYNYRYFLDYVSELLREAAEGDRFAVVFMDLDRFKWVNDRYGHPTGDAVLEDVVTLVKREIRAEDVLARYGGDEFVILLRDVNREAAESALIRIQTRIQQYAFDGVEFNLGVSVGYSLYPDDADKVGPLIELADQRMYENKVQRRLAL